MTIKQQSIELLTLKREMDGVEASRKELEKQLLSIPAYQTLLEKEKILKDQYSNKRIEIINIASEALNDTDKGKINTDYGYITFTKSIKSVIKDEEKTISFINQMGWQDLCLKQSIKATEFKKLTEELQEDIPGVEKEEVVDMKVFA